MIEQNVEWLVGRRYLSAHSIEALLDEEERRTNPEDEEALALTAA